MTGMNKADIRHAGALTLQPIDVIHLAGLWQAYHESRDELAPYLFWVESTHTPADIMNYIRCAQTNRENGTEYVFIAVAPSGSILASMGLHHVHSSFRSAELGYWVRTSATGHGVASAAAARLIRLAFEELGLHRIMVRHALENIKSKSVIDKLGFVHEGIVREDMQVNSRWLSHVAYGMLEHEYLAQRARLMELEEQARIDGL